MAQLLSVNIASSPRVGSWTGDKGSTGIDKRPVSHRVRVLDDQVEGDHVVDRDHHGGHHKAVYVYSREDAEWWEREIGRTIEPGAFGENLTTLGIDINDAVVGETWRIGTALLCVTEPRIPCRVFAGFWDRPHLVREFTQAGRSGTYLAIVEEGDIGAGDRITVESTPPHDVTVARLFRARTSTGAGRDEVREARPWLGPKWQSWLDVDS